MVPRNITAVQVSHNMRAASKIVHLSFAGHRSSAVDDAKYRFRPLYTTLVWTTEKRSEGEPNIHLLTTHIYPG